jgi:PDZ domain
MIDLQIFISSPHDVGNERAVCGTVVSRIQLEFRGLVRLRPIFWENELLRPDRTFQSQIPRASEADACVFILWSWFGTPLPPDVARRPDGTTYRSGYARCSFGKIEECADVTGQLLARVLVIDRVFPGSTAERVKLRAGDRLVSYDGVAVTEMQAFIDQVAKPGSDPRLLIVARQRERLSIPVPPGRLGIEIANRYLPPSKLASP